MRLSLTLIVIVAIAYIVGARWPMLARQVGIA